ncbi:DUF4169 family protein [Fulvimarina sp. MAC3]|uniref:DUF4169 family protein n=1 Tax=Fulvimarina sp. MAC3 TaxID=3148887 RepID=UPI0031FDEF47
MGDIVNLRRARKAKARIDREAEAADNRIKFGTPARLKSLEDALRSRAHQALDGHKRDRGQLTSRDDAEAPDDPA